MNCRYAIKKPLSLRLYSTVRHTGFRYQEVEEGTTFEVGDKDYNHILFLLDGHIQISCNEFINKSVSSGELMLIPISADSICKASTNCQILLFSFEEFFIALRNSYVNDLNKLTRQSDYDFILLPFCDALYQFTEHLSMYIRQGLDKPVLHEIKHLELQIILQSFYSKKEIAAFFYPLIGSTPVFRTQILRNYRKIDHIDDLASHFGLEKRTFGRQFKDEFGTSPYQWLLNQKAKHIHFSLAESQDSLDTIRKQYGFKFAGHFTRFCKEYFDCTPKKLMRKIRFQIT